MHWFCEHAYSWGSLWSMTMEQDWYNSQLLFCAVNICVCNICKLQNSIIVCATIIVEMVNKYNLLKMIKLQPADIYVNMT